jgi:hypothetical protein
LRASGSSALPHNLPFSERAAILQAIFRRKGEVRSRRLTGPDQAAACAQAIDNAVREYAKLQKSYKGRTAIKNLTDFRNKMLAHTLLGEAMEKRPSYDDLFLLMDAARDITSHAKFAILGENLSMMNYEEERVRASKVFWSLALKIPEC